MKTKSQKPANPCGCNTQVFLLKDKNTIINNANLKSKQYLESDRYKPKKQILNQAKIRQKESSEGIKIDKKDSAITLIALVITTIFSYDEKLKCSNNKGFLLATI